MFVVKLDRGEGVAIGDGPERGVVIKVVEGQGRRLRLAIETRMKISRIIWFGLDPPRFPLGLAAADVASSGETV